MELLIVDKSGWSMPVKVQRATTRIGSASSNDVCLQSPQIAALHLQVFYSPDFPSSCKIVNMAGEVRVKLGQEIRALSTFATVDIRDGDEVVLGDYRIKLSLPVTANVLFSGKLIEASLEFAEPVLRPEFEAVGYLKVKNAGNSQNCQFQIEVDGLAPDCIQIDPIPLMYPGAQEEVRVLVIHHGQYPPAGLQQVIFRITAPESYPGEKCVIQQGLFVTPVFEQSLDIIDDVVAAGLKELVENPSKPVPPVQPDVNVSTNTVNTLAMAPDTLVSRTQIESEVASTDKNKAEDGQPHNQISQPTVEVIPVSEPPRTAIKDQSQGVRQVSPQTKPDLANLKVVRGPADEFWNEL